MKKGLVDSDEESGKEEGGDGGVGEGAVASLQRAAEVTVGADHKSSEEEADESDLDDVIM